MIKGIVLSIVGIVCSCMAIFIVGRIWYVHLCNLPFSKIFDSSLKVPEEYYYLGLYNVMVSLMLEANIWFVYRLIKAILLRC